MKRVLSLFVINAMVHMLHAENFIINPEKVSLVERAWSVNTGGRTAPAYYEMTINGKLYKGARLWDLRWDMIKDVTSYTQKNVLELGCNMALLSTCLKKYRKANRVVGIEAPNWLLAKQGSPHRLKAAEWFAQAFEVDVTFMQIDLDRDPTYEDKIGYNYDVVFCLSLMHWIKDKERLLCYLSKFNELIYEGHESLEIEWNRLQRHGFNNYAILGYAGRGPVLYVTK